MCIVPEQWLRRIPSPVHPDALALLAWKERLEEQLAAAVAARDADRKQWERERDSYAEVVRKTVEKRDEAEAHVEDRLAKRYRDGFVAGHDEGCRERETLMASHDDAERRWDKARHEGDAYRRLFESANEENRRLIAAAEGRTAPRCFLCTPFWIHVARLRARGAEFRFRLRESYEQGQARGLAARAALGRAFGWAWSRLSTPIFFAVVGFVLCGVMVALASRPVAQPGAWVEREPWVTTACLGSPRPVDMPAVMAPDSTALVFSATALPEIMRIEVAVGPTLSIPGDWGAYDHKYAPCPRCGRECGQAHIQLRDEHGEQLFDGCLWCLNAVVRAGVAATSSRTWR